MWCVSGLSCRKSGSCHSHIDGCDCYVPTGITFSFLHPSCASMLWIEWFFCFSLVLFDGLIIALLRLFVNTFLRFYGIIFIYLFCYVFIFYNLFVFFIIFCKFVVLWREGGCERTAGKGGGVRVGLRRSSASKAAWILLKPLKKSQNSRLPPLKQLGFFQQRSLPTA